MDSTLIKFATRLPLVIIPTRYGVLATPPVSPKAQMLGTYEHSALRVIKSTLRPDDVFVDVGAHAGHYTLIARALPHHPIQGVDMVEKSKFLP